MNAPAAYDIEALAEKAGVTRRTVRFYVQTGLLPPPNGAGRGARYDEGHLRRLLEIGEQKGTGRTLDDIRGAPAKPEGPASRPLPRPLPLLPPSVPFPFPVPPPFESSPFLRGTEPILRGRAAEGVEVLLDPRILAARGLKAEEVFERIRRMLGGGAMDG